MMLLVGIGGFFGAIARYWLGKRIMAWSGSRFPVGTWAVNLSGSFLLGMLAGMHGNVPEWAPLFLGTGFLGAFTTFSTFGYETLQLIRNRRIGAAALYVVSSVVFGICFAWAGSAVM